MLPIVSYTRIKIYGINKKGTLGTKCLAGSADIMDIISCFVWKCLGWIQSPGLGVAGWSKGGRTSGWAYRLQGGINPYMPSQGHWNLFLVMDKEQGLSWPSIVMLINIIDLPMTLLGMEMGFVLWACVLSCWKGRLFWAHNGPYVGVCGQLLLFLSSPGLQFCRGCFWPCSCLRTDAHADTQTWGWLLWRLPPALLSWGAFTPLCKDVSF